MAMCPAVVPSDNLSMSFDMGIGGLKANCNRNLLVDNRNNVDCTRCGDMYTSRGGLRRRGLTPALSPRRPVLAEDVDRSRP